MYATTMWLGFVGSTAIDGFCWTPGPRGDRLVGRHGERRLVDAQPLVGVVGRDVVHSSVAGSIRKPTTVCAVAPNPAGGLDGRVTVTEPLVEACAARPPKCKVWSRVSEERDRAVGREQEGDVERRGVAVALVGQGVIDRDRPAPSSSPGPTGRTTRWPGRRPAGCRSRSRWRSARRPTSTVCSAPAAGNVWTSPGAGSVSTW